MHALVCLCHSLHVFFILPCPPPNRQVEVDLALSAHANARAYYDSRRKHQVGGGHGRGEQGNGERVPS